jgi:site-specific recombinase XerD
MASGESSRPELWAVCRLQRTRSLTRSSNDVNFHTLRHTFASWAVMRGVSLKELQELLGHSSLAMTMRYAHLAPERLRSAVTRLEGLTSGKPATESAQASTQGACSPEGVLPNSA